MKYEPKKIYLSSNNGYIEISYQEFCEYCKSDASFEDKYFLPLYGVLMEVPKEVYTEFYKDRRRQKYLMEQSANNGDFSYDMLTTEEFNGADILLDSKADVEEQVEKKIMLDKLLEAIYLLSDDEVDLIKALFYDGLTEREYARKRGIYHNAVHKQKGRILAKLKKFLEI